MGSRERAVGELGGVGTGRSRLGLAPSALALDVCGPGHVGFHTCRLRIPAGDPRRLCVFTDVALPYFARSECD